MKPVYIEDKLHKETKKIVAEKETTIKKYVAEAIEVKNESNKKEM